MSLLPVPSRPRTSTRTGSSTTTAAQETVKVDRANYDIKLTLPAQRVPLDLGQVLDAGRRTSWTTSSWAGTTAASATRRSTSGRPGHTWTLSPTLVLDGNFGYYRMDQTVTGPDYGTELRPASSASPAPTTRTTSARAACRSIDERLRHRGARPSWMPLFRKEQNYTFSTALTKVFTEARGADRRGRRQADAGPPPGGVRRLRAARRLPLRQQRRPAPPDYISPGWNSFAAVPAGPRRLLRQGRPDRDDDGARVADGVLRQRPLARQRQGDAEPRPARRELPADEPREQRASSASTTPPTTSCWAGAGRCRRTWAST